MHRDIWAGVDIGGTKTAVVLSSNPPEVICRTEFPTKPWQGPQPAIDQIKAALYRMISELKSTSHSLRGIGVTCGGPLDPHSGVIQAPPNLPTWIEVPIVEILATEFGCAALLENDANGGALAEHRYGAGQGARHMVFLTMGTGLGGGIIIQDKLYRGANDMAGEIGHVRLTQKGPVGYNKAGSAEGWASGVGLAQIAERVLKNVRTGGQKTVLLDLPQEHKLTAKDVGLAATSGDAVACRIVRICGKKLGLALAVLVDILNPERIVIGGLALRLGERLLEPARNIVQREALSSSARVCQIVPAALGEKIGDVAAICVAMGLSRSLPEADSSAAWVVETRLAGEPFSS